MFSHCLLSLTITIVITIISNQAFILQCQNCWCIPDYCVQTVPRSLCPCDGTQKPCSRTTAEVQTILTGINAYQQQQQQFMLPHAPVMKYYLIQQPVQSIPPQISGQLMVENQQQQQFMQTLTSLQQQILSQQMRTGGIQQPSMPPVYVVRTVEQPGQVLRQVQQIPASITSSQYVPAIAVQQAPMLQTQLMVIPSVQQVIPQTQQFVLPLQVPMQTVTLQVPVTMAEHCTPRKNVCPVGLPSVHAVTQCDNVTDTTATRCITVEEARRLYTCLPYFNFDKLWDN
ncbi:hypothetical protein LOAG_03879 [Loa loa]|uniref:Uncharacterized protein n=1 Tax=Loa loa TaxID=7209 RepID=A0A1S0U3D5_LOALO|nr:hypothetical protein LOAG_03879 [Loa loa]EFO24600.1 hypothetical protein LOAG_03879 [Loa loa]